MGDSFRLSFAERIGYLNGDLNYLADVERAPTNLGRQSLPLDILHGDEARAVVVPNVVDSGDVRMLESGGGIRLTGKAPHPVLICSHPCRQDFQSHHTVEPRVLGQIDFTHPPSAQQPHELIVAERLAY